MKTKNLDTGNYSVKLSKKAAKIERKSKSGRIRRTVFLILILFACVTCIIIGISSRSKSIESQYQKYIASQDILTLNNELISYKDVSERFETTFLGNKGCLSLMGGFFYNGEDYSIFPDESCCKMILHSSEAEQSICDCLASDINVINGTIYYRKLNSRTISTFNITDKMSNELPVQNVGQFIICGDVLYYIDLKSSALNSFNLASLESKEIIESGVISFIVAGNNIFYLSDDHVLSELNMNDNIKETIGNNISSFSYNGKLWMQNNDKVYTKYLDNKAIHDFHFDIPCNRLLGVTASKVYFESNDGIYACAVESSTSQKIAEGTFISASDDNVLIYSTTDDAYKIVTSK